ETQAPTIPAACIRLPVTIDMRPKTLRLGGTARSDFAETLMKWSTSLHPRGRSAALFYPENCPCKRFAMERRTSPPAGRAHERRSGVTVLPRPLSLFESSSSSSFAGGVLGRVRLQPGRDHKNHHGFSR